MRRLSLLALAVAAVAAVVLALGPRAVLTAPDSALPWSVSGSGGGTSSSASYELGFTVGQSSVAGESGSTNYGLVAGLWSGDGDGDGAPPSVTPARPIQTATTIWCPTVRLIPMAAGPS